MPSVAVTLYMPDIFDVEMVFLEKLFLPYKVPWGTHTVHGHNRESYGADKLNRELKFWN